MGGLWRTPGLAGAEAVAWRGGPGALAGAGLKGTWGPEVSWSDRVN